MVFGRTACGVQQSCTCASVWQGRDVVHSDTVRRRNAASLVESWLPPPMVAAAALQRAKQQGGGSPAALGIAEPLTCASDLPNENIVQAPGSEPCASAVGGQASPVVSLDLSSMNLLASGPRRFLGGWLADQAAVRSGEKRRREEKSSRRKKRKRVDGDSSSSVEFGAAPGLDSDVLQQIGVDQRNASCAAHANGTAQAQPRRKGWRGKDSWCD